MKRSATLNLPAVWERFRRPPSSVWGRRLLVRVRFWTENMPNIATARSVAAGRQARRSGITAPLCHIWPPAAPLNHRAGPYGACMHSSVCVTSEACRVNPDRVLGKWALFMIFRPRQHQNKLYTGTFTGYKNLLSNAPRVPILGRQHSRRFQIWSQIWQGVTIKNIDFLYSILVSIRYRLNSTFWGLPVTH